MIFNNFDILNGQKQYFKLLEKQETTGTKFKNKEEQFKKFYFPLAKLIYKRFKKKKRTILVGLGGGQGVGKTTMSEILKLILNKVFLLETVTFSIDDFYKTFSERKKMSKNISKLFLTRGVPGTHDIIMLRKIIKSLKKKKFKRVEVPKFDKSSDDRFPKNKWTKVIKKPNIIIFEGWCVGAKNQKLNSLKKPINELERKEDKDLSWRKKVNYELYTNYKRIFKLIDIFIFLKVPSFKFVYKWRLLQEKKLRKISKGKKIMNNLQVKRFIMFYERITRNMFKSLSIKPKILVKIDVRHRFKAVKST